MLVDFLGLLMAGSSQIVSSQVNRHFSTLALMREKMRAGSRLHSDVQKAGRGRTLYVTHVYYTVFPSLLEYLYPQGLMGVHTGASRNCGSQSFPSCTPPSITKKSVFPQHFESYLVLLAASSASRDWWYVVVTPRRAIGPDRILRFVRGRPP